MKSGIAPIARWNVDPAKLAPVPLKCGVPVGDGWLSGLRLDGDIAGETARSVQHMNFPPLSPHHQAATWKTEAKLDHVLKHPTLPFLFDAGHMAFAGSGVAQ